MLFVSVKTNNSAVKQSREGRIIRGDDRIDRSGSQEQQLDYNILSIVSKYNKFDVTFVGRE